MTTLKKSISFVIPVYNEAAIIKKNINKLLRYCRKNQIAAEVLLCENGSTDNTREILASLYYPKLKKILLADRGIGAAYKAGIKAATHPIIYFSGIDFPFGYNNILDCHNSIGQYDMVFASKAHPKSIIRTRHRRALASITYRFFIKFLLGIKTRDPQGCTMFKRTKIMKFINRCDSVDAFFATQLALYSEANKLRTIEIPVHYINGRSKSKFSIIGDGWAMLKQTLKENRRLANHAQIKVRIK